MNTSKWMILGALAGLAGIAVNKQLRMARNRLAEALPDAEGRPSIDDIPTEAPAEAPADVPTVQAAAEGRVPDFDERVAPGAPF
jgi:hypothetical protein